ncbi:MAG: hypothetical protein V3W08_12300 [Candidatus Binatia bacterium]
MKPCVFIQTNHKQIVGAIVASHALKRNSKHADEFDVRIIHHKDYQYFLEKEGQSYLRDRVYRKWQNNDLQSFTLTRFMPPELIGYEGIALCIDPDIFAVRDVWELFSSDMEGKAIWACRPKSDPKAKEGQLASSVMLLDCAKLKHWNVEEQFNAMFEGKIDYMDWISLKLEPRDSIGILEPEWNHFDKLTAKTMMIHNTKRRTQPWKAGLPVDFMTPERNRRHPLAGWFWRMRRRIFGPYAFLGHYQPHPDKRQEQFFFGLVKECMEKGTLTEEIIKEQMRYNHVRHDALEVTKRAPDLEDLMAEVRKAA